MAQQRSCRARESFGRLSPAACSCSVTRSRVKRYWRASRGTATTAVHTMTVIQRPWSTPMAGRITAGNTTATVAPISSPWALTVTASWLRSRGSVEDRGTISVLAVPYKVATTAKKNRLLHSTAAAVRKSLPWGTKNRSSALTGSSAPLSSR